ncbi:MAG: hypothetical protein HOM14_01960 [Gammaproteobacteria bacterium]|jgi:hypothetical protein|nr:hypothetical protein [Gammaproteobacteria bacterium]MBT3725016.1 hypothetical protein [Gammaproteobacteria bacterium]MBT4075079.1 hypothetical protein [Gammaproteobacteria bacterium]MBT4193860.1 hypothetical protein [Gammaproteobacteria bacterium]MBT4449727.1 hypothetical protein [Gammaproteobacteria bacterium]
MTIHYGYVQARVQARYAVLPDESIWLHIGALKTLAGFLEEARGTVLAQWVFGLTGNSSAEEIENQLQQQFLGTIIETADWFDEQWHPAVLWLSTLVQLPTLDYLIRSKKPVEDSISDPLLLELLDQKLQCTDIRQAWVDKWKAQWPNLSGQNSHNLELLLQLLQQHWSQFSSLSVNDTWQARSNLQVRLRLLFRRHVLQPSMAFIYLCLVVLCLERLRAELLRRALFPEVKGAA